MPPLPVFALLGLGVGVVFGLFGAGGSAFTTPLLALLGVPPILAVATPLPATLPAAIGGAWRYRKDGEVDLRTAALAATGGVPAALIGAVLSRQVSGQVLLVMSGVTLALAGARLVRPVRAAADHEGRLATSTIVAATSVVGFLSGLLANGGGFLLVPLFLLGLHLGMREAAGTSLVVVAALSVPTLATHWALGHIDWPLSLVLAAGLVPGSQLGARLSKRLRPERTQRAFAVVLLAFATWFTLRVA